MQASFQDGKAALQPSGEEIAMLVFRDYVKPGDTVTLAFDTVAKKVRSFDVNSYPDAPEDAVTLKLILTVCRMERTTQRNQCSTQLLSRFTSGPQIPITASYSRLRSSAL